MSDYRRFFVPGGTYFFTLVTARRAPLFADEEAVHLLGEVTRRVLAARPATVVALVLLPDHLHAIWTLPPGDSNYATRWRLIKRNFTTVWLARGGREPAQTARGHAEQRRGVWQRRFWEHTIRDEADLEAHFDYVHYNPVKHGFARSARDWPWSSFHRYAAAGHYPPNWSTAPDETRIAKTVGE